MRMFYRQNLTGIKEIKKVFMITLCWVLIQSILYLQDYLSTLELIHLEKLSGTFEFWPDFINNLSLSVFGGAIGGTLLVTKISGGNGQKSIPSGLFGSSLFFILCYLLLATIGLFITGFIYYTFQGDIQNAFHRSVNNMIVNLFTPSIFVAMVVWGLLVSITQFMLQMNDKLGHGVLWNFVNGKYRRPREEERIFMFLDLKGATSIAEKMESGRFFEMLKEIYKDINTPILKSNGEIYQYVGDEVVISWPVNKGIKNNNALQCFFRIDHKITEKKAKYLEKYGIAPTFKAGLHLGKATIGEIGVTKKEIVYSGDVLNTTSRIQSLCNSFGVKILISSALLQLMKLGGKYLSISMGEIDLRGKEHKIALNTVQAL